LLLEVLRHAADRLWQRDVPVLAGGLAFFGVLSIFPTLALAVLIYGFVSVPEETIALADTIKHVVPSRVYDLIVLELSALARSAPHHLTPAIMLATALTVWSSMSGWKALISGIYLVSGQKNQPGIVGYQFQSLLLSFLFIGIIVSAMLGYIVLVRIVSAESSSFARSPIDYIQTEMFIWCTAGVGICGGLLTIYRVTLARSTASTMDCLKGAIGGALTWILAIALFDLYAEKASWRSIYGALTGSIAFLLWLYVSAYAALFGAAIAASFGRISCNNAEHSKA